MRGSGLRGFDCLDDYGNENEKVQGYTYEQKWVCRSEPCMIWRQIVIHLS